MPDTHDLLTVSYEYRHEYGHLRAFFDGLAEGRAVGSHCEHCDRRWFPPRRLCDGCDKTTIDTELSPVGCIEFVTITPDPDCQDVKAVALARFGTACNLATVTVRAAAGAVVGQRLRLSPAENPVSHPGEHLNAQ